MNLNKKELAKYIDHTILGATATADDVRRVCKEAKEYGFKSVCVNSFWVPLVKEELQGSDVLVCSVVGFPLGAMLSEAKALETRLAVESGAQEIDMVINVGALKNGYDELVKKDIADVVNAAGDALVKVIIETCYLNDQEKIRVCKLAVAAGAHFVKTSTGFGSGGATVEDITLMRDLVGPDIGVKASGGVRTREDAFKMIEAGASRIGASSGIKIVEGDSDEDIHGSY